MSKQAVIVTAKPDGSVVVETTGVVGPACEVLSKAIESAVGATTANQRKPEYNQRQQVVQPAAAKQGAG
jgi:hypothetical protein